jgi:hypothetical protein
MAIKALEIEGISSREDWEGHREQKLVYIFVSYVAF